MARPRSRYVSFSQSDSILGFSLPEELKRYHVKLAVDPQTLRTAQQKGERVIMVNGKPQVMHYVKTPIRESRQRTMAAIRAVFPVVVRPPDANHPWQMIAVYRYHPKGLTKDMLGQYKMTSPDLDNLVKDLKDCITRTGVAWEDDRQVVIESASKMYVCSLDEPAHVELKLVQLPIKKQKDIEE